MKDYGIKLFPYPLLKSPQNIEIEVQNLEFELEKGIISLFT